ncbi:MAG: hypothetical protein MJH10_15035, partial [Epibacterium sp.]|nr:hypothetical protein [Epibacterium sp.]NQX74835.1 hypothetical protein [Epibacterium sp.]
NATNLSNESTAALNQAAENERNANRIASNERMNFLDNETQRQVEALREQGLNNREQDRIRNDIWSDFDAQIMNIDINASPTSQREQMHRIFHSTQIRLEAMGFINEAAGVGGDGGPNYQGPFYPTDGWASLGGSLGGTAASFTSQEG